jgi:hypothetical protein
MSHPLGREQQSVAYAPMVPFVMVVLDELVNRTAQCAFADEDQSIQAGFLDRPDEALRVGIEIWGTGRQADRLDAGRRERVTERVAEPWIAIMQEEAFPSQASVNRIGNLATAPNHPGTVRLREDAGDLHSSRREVDHEQDGEARQPSSGPDFDREEVRGREHASMRTPVFYTPLLESFRRSRPPRGIICFFNAAAKTWRR